MDIVEGSELIAVGEGIVIEELFLKGHISTIPDLYRKSKALVFPNGDDFTVKIVTPFRNVIYIRFNGDEFFIGRFLSRA